MFKTDTFCVTLLYRDTQTQLSTYSTVYWHTDFPQYALTLEQLKNVKASATESFLLDMPHFRHKDIRWTPIAIMPMESS